MWYVIQTMTREEHHFIEMCKLQIPDMESMGELFVTTIVMQKHYGGEWHMVKENMFPGYVFIDTGRIDCFYKRLNDLTCFSKLLKTGEDIVPVTDEEKQFLCSMMDDDYCVGYSQGFLIGSEVVITEGALKNQKGRIRRVNRHRRIAELEICLFSRLTKVEVGLGAFAKVTEEEWEKIRQDCIEQQEDVLAECGQRVQVQTGAFQGMQGKLLSWEDDKKQCQVEIELFGAPTKVTFQKDEVYRIPD